MIMNKESIVKFNVAWRMPFNDRCVFEDQIAEHKGKCLAELSEF